MKINLLSTNNSKKRQHTFNPDRLLGISGLGGWLILVQFGLIMSLIALLVQTPSYYFDVIDDWIVLTSKASELYHPLWGITVVFELLYNTLLIGLLIYTLVMFYRKKSIVPRLMIILYSTHFISCIIDFVLIHLNPIASQMDDGLLIMDVFRAAITFAIWVPYFLKSKRVKNTFVR